MKTIDNSNEGKIVPFNQMNPDQYGDWKFGKEQLVLQEMYKMILQHIGDDPTREGLLETPKRHLKFLLEFTNPDPFNFTTFDAEGYDDMVIQSNIKFYSLCEHHIVPFEGMATVAYIPGDRMVGLSKLARTVKFCARSLQNQERITNQVAQMLEDNLNPKGVAVILKATHKCMEMRGVEACGAETITTKFTGVFDDNQQMQDRLFQRLAA